MAETCRKCGDTLQGNDRFVLVSGEAFDVHCSESCLRERSRELQVARWNDRRRYALPLLVVLAVALASVAWRSRRKPLTLAIVSGPPVVAGEAGPRGPKPFGPPWPPTDEDWLVEFAQSSWIYPLPGPFRRIPERDSRVFGAERPGDRLGDCNRGRCGVDLGGELWGEHVYAAHDGVVDRVTRGPNEQHGGSYVRLSHWGGMVFTQYFHLAAVSRKLTPGAPVKAGDIIGLLGDTGIKDGHAHLHFTISVKPSREFIEVYMDPEPLMTRWPLHTPTQGSVLGLVSMANPEAHALAAPAPRRHTPRRKKDPAVSEPVKDEPDSTVAPD